MKRLLVISSAPVALVNNQPHLDKKFCDGMKFYCNGWDGPVSCVLRLQDSVSPFGQTFDRDDLPFDIKLITKEKRLGAEDLRNFDLVLCCGDSHENYYLAEICKSLSVKIIFTVEYILETRIQIALLDQSKSLPRKIYSILWTLNSERHRRRAFGIADGIQANGYPAYNAYKSVNRNTSFYLDSRIDSTLLAGVREMAARREYLNSGGPIRLLHSGRLEPMKGSQDIIPIAKALARKQVDFELNIFGTGSLENEIKQAIKSSGLDDRVFFHGAVDFKSELVPFAKSKADIFLSCHRQSDPSCTYIESMGCGLAIAGYSNRMWEALNQESGAGWSVPLGDKTSLVNALKQAAEDRRKLVERCENAHVFGANRSFEREFSRRIQHLSSTFDNTEMPIRSAVHFF